METERTQSRVSEILRTHICLLPIFGHLWKLVLDCMKANANCKNVYCLSTKMVT